MLTEKEIEILGKLKNELSDNQTKRDIKLISAVFADIECKFGSEVFAFMVHYYSRLIERCDAPYDNSTMELVSSMAGAFDEFGDAVNSAIGDEVYEKCSYNDMDVRMSAVSVLDGYFDKLNSTLNVK